MRMAGGKSEKGAGTVLMVGLVFSLLVLLALLLLLVQAAVGASRASTAADLAALAAADAARGLTAGEACTVAAEVSERHGVELVSCQQVGAQGHLVDVSTRIDISPVLGAATAKARAGPPPPLP